MRVLVLALMCSVTPSSLQAAKPLQRPAFGPQHLSPLQELRNDLAKNGEILGTLFDTRSREAIAADRKTQETLVYSLEKWQRLGPSQVDLYGWDDAFGLKDLLAIQKAMLGLPPDSLIRYKCGHGGKPHVPAHKQR